MTDGYCYYPLSWQAALELLGPWRYDTTLKLIDFDFFRARYGWCASRNSFVKPHTLVSELA